MMGWSIRADALNAGRRSVVWHYALRKVGDQ